MFPIWIVSIIATLYIAHEKKLDLGGYFFLSLITGPLAVIIVLLASRKNLPKEDRLSQSAGLEEARRQLQDLKFSLSAQEEKIKNLELLINKLSGQEAAVPLEETPKPEPVVLQEVIPVKKSDMELDFGRNWLSKIGIAVLGLGMAFLISYTFKYFGPFLKIGFGYLVGGVLFFAGTKLEVKEKLTGFGRAILGGAWAIIYFTTYAMYHFEGSRIITNQGLEIFFLVLVVVGMIAHVLKYQSEEMMAVALVVAYLTSTIGEITSFTMMSTLCLAVVVLFLVYKFQWVKTLSLGIILTYVIHFVWVMPHMTVYNRDLMNLIFLTSYWAVFFVGVHLIRSVKDPLLVRPLATTNFANIALYSVLSYPLISNLFYAERFTIVLMEGLIYLAAGLMMKRAKQEKNVCKRHDCRRLCSDIFSDHQVPAYLDLALMAHRNSLLTIDRHPL